MRPTLQYVTSIDHPETGLWVLAVPIGGGSVEAMSAETANQGAREGAREGWLEGWPPADLAPAPERSGQAEFDAAAQDLLDERARAAAADAEAFRETVARRAQAHEGLEQARQTQPEG